MKNLSLGFEAGRVVILVGKMEPAMGIGLPRF